jgi:chromosome segregation ATPase
MSTALDELRRRITALAADIAGAEAKAARLTVSITTRRQTLARLRAQLDEIERGAGYAKHEH